MALLQERYPDLAEHSTQVGSLAVGVGRALRLTPDELAQLKDAAELHDIGKLAIPDAILDKPGPLSDREWEFIHRHTVIGERILCAAPMLAGVGTIIRATHERFDGHGYPDGLAGTNIPLAARIISVCDSFDAMTSPRTYRSPLGRECAIEELRRRSGAQFDPEVVEAFVAAAAQLDREPADTADVHQLAL